MKPKPILLLSLLSGALALVPSARAEPPTQVSFRATTSTAIITLGDLLMTVTIPTVSEVRATFLQPAPFTFRRGTHLQIVAQVEGLKNPVVTWYKDGKTLPQTSGVLDIPASTSADSGGYSAMVRESGTNVITSSATADVLINEMGPPVVNISTRARLNPAQPSILTGFVIQPGSAQALVLVRAVGPALAQFGVADPLATPALRVLDSSGREVPRWGTGTIINLLPTGVQSVAGQVGAFPLPAGGKDIEWTYSLSPGAYTVEVTSADGGSGTVLLETYQLPL